MNVILDLETLSTEYNALALEIAAVALDDSHGVHSTFNAKLNGLSHADSGALHIDNATLNWWSKQHNFVAVSSGITEYCIGMAQFCSWLNAMQKELGSEAKVWGRGSDFDNVILANSIKFAKLDLPWKFRNNRCLRTLSELSRVDPNNYVRLPGEEAHTALGDAMFEARVFKHSMLALNT